LGMDDLREKLRNMIVVEDISAIQIMSERTGLSEDDVRDVLHEIVEAGELSGHFTPDGSRFFRDDIPPPPATKGPEEEPPEFMKYDTRPGRIVATIGFIVVVGSLVGRVIVSGSVAAENVAHISLLAGLVVLMAGCYQIGRRPTP